jgi:glycosyltransferase involved in cell wall biosynthesis
MTSTSAPRCVSAPSSERAAMKIAIVHDWLDTWAGSERVLVEMAALFPAADLYALVDFLPQTERTRLNRAKIGTTFIQRLPFARRHFRKYLSLMPLAMEQLDMRGYDLVISSCHAVSKAVLTGPDQLHICMCYSPPRYAWDLQSEYLQQAGLDHGLLGWIARRMLHQLRLADLRAATGVDRFVAISHYIARRIAKCYRREAMVIYPPVDIPADLPTCERGNDYVTVSRLVAYKRVDLLIEAFRALPERTLHIIGDGPERLRLSMLAGPNVQLHGNLSDSERDRLLDQAAAFVFAAEEDFGIAPLEAQARGLPVIAYARGGTGETIAGLEREMPTGVLFAAQDATAIAAAVRVFERERGRIAPEACRANAQRFSPQRFRAEFAAFVESTWREFDAARGH